MVNIKALLSGVANILSFVMLQLLAANIFGENCFIYIGAIIFLDWTRSNVVWHMLAAFCVGFLFDVAYHTLGVHTFSLVLLAYVKYFIMVLFVPGYREGKISLTVKDLGPGKIILFTISCVLIFYVSLFVLSFFKDIIFTTGMIKNIGICSGLLCLSQVIFTVIDLIVDEK